MRPNRLNIRENPLALVPLGGAGFMVCAFILDAAPVRQAETGYATDQNDSIRYRLASGHLDQAIGGGYAHDPAIAICDLPEIVCFLASSQALGYEVS